MTADAFSQDRFQDYADCAYRYLLRYVRRLEGASGLAIQLGEQGEAIERDALFRLLVQRTLTGLADDVVSRHVDDPVAIAWWRRFAATGMADLPARRLTDVTLVAPLDGVLISARLDVLAAERAQIVIVELQTHGDVEAQDGESRVRMAVCRWVTSRAASASLGFAVKPEHVRTRIWSAEDGAYRDVQYSKSLQAQDQAELRTLLQRIRSETEFPKTDDMDHCRSCAYRPVCRPHVPPGPGVARQYAASSNVDLEPQ